MTSLKPIMGHPLIAFVHVPKTAGSTVNKALTRHKKTGYEHCEAILDKPDAFSKAMRHAEWVSGHVNYTELRRRLKETTERPLRFFTAMRNPTDQIMSHYNWLIEIFHRDDRFYNTHPDHIKVLSERIRGTDHSNPEAIANLLRDYAGSFLNIQSKTILGSDFNWNSGRIMRRLSEYEFVATERDLDQMLELMTRSNSAAKHKENVSQYHYDREVFEEPRLRNFLMRHNFLDWALYEAVNSAQIRVAATPRFRRLRAKATA